MLRKISSPAALVYPVKVIDLQSTEGKLVRKGSLVARLQDSSGRTVSVASPFDGVLTAYDVRIGQTLVEVSKIGWIFWEEQSQSDQKVRAEHVRETTDPNAMARPRPTTVEQGQDGEISGIDAAVGFGLTALVFFAFWYSGTASLMADDLPDWPKWIYWVMGIIGIVLLWGSAISISEELRKIFCKQERVSDKKKATKTAKKQPDAVATSCDKKETDPAVQTPKDPNDPDFSLFDGIFGIFFTAGVLCLLSYFGILSSIWESSLGLWRWGWAVLILGLFASLVIWAVGTAASTWLTEKLTEAPHFFSRAAGLGSTAGQQASVFSYFTGFLLFCAAIFNLWIWTHAIDLSGKPIWWVGVMSMGAGLSCILLLGPRGFDPGWRRQNRGSFLAKIGLSSLFVLSVLPSTASQFPWTSHEFRSPVVSNIFYGIAMELPPTRVSQENLNRLEAYARSNF